MNALTGNHYEVLVEHSPVMIWRAGVDAQFDYFNETWLHFTGRTLAQEMGDGWSEGVHEDDVEVCLATHRSNFERRQTFEMEYRLRRHDGQFRYVLDRGVPVCDSNGAFAGFIGTCVDVQDRRELNHDKAVFMSMLAHEQRTPLTAMKAFTESMRRRSVRGEIIDAEMYRKLDGQFNHVAKLVSDLSEAARLEQGHPPYLVFEACDLHALVRRVVARHRSRLESRTQTDRGHTIEIVEGHAVVAINGDRRRLENVFSDLLDNAIKFSPRGGRIEIRLSGSPQEHEVTISDEGVGIPAADLASVSRRRFYRASNVSKDLFAGLGLGLVLARDVIEAHGGSLQITSDGQRGTTLMVRLPTSVGSEAMSS